MVIGMITKEITYKPLLACNNQVTTYFQRRIAQQQQVLKTVQALLPESLAKQVRYCLVKDKKLLVYTDSAIWASQLRFYQVMMQAAVESAQTVQIKIIADPVRVPQTERKALLPSAEKIAQLHQDSLIIADESLRIAMLKLSTTLERLSQQSNK